ncbi:hypothetical protein MTS1_02339 [Microbacterium sp. TS-1]|nr:hypothetical protein MTS1_02339 [Microbacterium sp. TS-1]
MAMIARVKPIFRRRSGVRKTRAMALNKWIPPKGWAASREDTVNQGIPGRSQARLGYDEARAGANSGPRWRIT